MRVLVTGDRAWSDRAAIRRALTHLLVRHGEFTLVEGEAPGADTIAREEALKMHLEVDPFPANWRRFRGGAGPMRNRDMIDSLDPDDWVVWFHDDLRNSRGTADCVGQAADAGFTPTDGRYLAEHGHG